MSFIRSEVTGFLWRWREAIAVGLPGVFGLWLIFLGGLVLVVVGLVIFAVSASVFVVAVRRGRLMHGHFAPGVVEVSERELSYFGPETGSVVSIQDLTRLEIVVRSDHGRLKDRLWILTHTGGAPLIIPSGSRGSDLLIDAFSVLPGVQFRDIERALLSRSRGRHVIWSKG